MSFLSHMCTDNSNCNCWVRKDFDRSSYANSCWGSLDERYNLPCLQRGCTTVSRVAHWCKDICIYNIYNNIHTHIYIYSYIYMHYCKMRWYCTCNLRSLNGVNNSTYEVRLDHGRKRVRVVCFIARSNKSGVGGMNFDSLIRTIGFQELILF